MCRVLVHQKSQELIYRYPLRSRGDILSSGGNRDPRRNIDFCLDAALDFEDFVSACCEDEPCEEHRSCRDHVLRLVICRSLEI